MVHYILIQCPVYCHKIVLIVTPYSLVSWKLRISLGGARTNAINNYLGRPSKQQQQILFDSNQFLIVKNFNIF